MLLVFFCYSKSLAFLTIIREVDYFMSENHAAKLSYVIRWEGRMRDWWRSRDSSSDLRVST